MNPQRDNADETGHMDTGTVMLQHALQIVADWMEPAYGFHLYLAAFKWDYPCFGRTLQKNDHGLSENCKKEWNHRQL